MSPLSNVPLFSNINVACQSITIGTETRDSVMVEPGIELLLTLPEVPAGYWKFSFGTTKPKSAGSIELASNGVAVGCLTAVLEGRWNLVRVENSLIPGELRISNRTDSAIYVGHPVFEGIYASITHATQNVIVIVLDSVWYGRIGLCAPQANQPSLTPNVDRFFRNAFLYKNSFSVAEWTLPSIYSILTSTYPVAHGNTDLATSPQGLPRGDEPSLAEVFAADGFSTMACSTSKIFTPAFAAHTGFHRFFYSAYPETGRASVSMTYKAIDHLEGNPDGRNFLFLHYIDTHEWWDSPSSSEQVKLGAEQILDPRTEYETLRQGLGDSKGEPRFDDSGIRILDKRLKGRLLEVDLHLQALFDYLEKRDLADKSVIVLTADHGFQYMGTNKPLLCDTRVHVPLLIRTGDGVAKEIEAFVSQGVDLAPTLLHLAGLNETSMGGQVLPPFGNQEDRPVVVSESLFSDKYKVAVRSRKATYHLTCKYDKEQKTIRLDELIDRHLFAGEDDRYEHDVREQMPELSAELHAALIDHLSCNARAVRFTSG